ncbi:MAG TPA: RAMP superfamily CRISPR-associated protein, partial [Kineosporiaceae bacterium]
MSWDVGKRHELRGVLVSEAPLHVGGWEPTMAADLALARDGQDRPVIPGTSIAGALRAWLTTSGAVADVDAVFGYVKGQEGKASRLRVDDAPVLDDVTPVVRTGVAIDRATRSAAAGYLYERELLPAGTRFAFRLVADEPAREKDPGVGEAFEALTAALRAGHVVLGAARTRGLGRVRLEAAQTRTTNLSDRAGLRAWLTDSSPWHELTGGPSGPPPGRLVVTVDWQPVTPVLVKDSLPGALVDALPLTTTDPDGKVRLVLPGSSVKGVLRAHAERIVRTLRGTPAPGSLAETL